MFDQRTLELERDTFGLYEVKMEKAIGTGSQKNPSYVSQSAVALRCRVMPPPCLKNPYLKNDSEIDIDPFGNQRSKYSGIICVLFERNLNR